MDKISTIKQELQRRYDMLPNNSVAGLMIFIKDYLNFIDETEFLKNIIKNEEKNFNSNIKKDKYKGFGFMLWPIYRDLPKMIKKTDDILFPRYNLIRENKFQKLLRKLGLRGTHSPHTKNYWLGIMRIFHDQLLKRIVEQELGKSEINKTTEIVKKLGIDDQTKWEDINIIFTNESDVYIKYKGREHKTNHIKLGFKDERTKDNSDFIDSWKFLILLASNEGHYPIGKDDSRKKQKQKLSRLLRENFQIIDDPFYDMGKENKEYKIRIRLTPDPIFRPDWKDRNIYDTDKPVQYLKPIQ